MIFGVLGAIGWFILQNTGTLKNYPKLIGIIEPLYLGLLFSIIGFFIFHKKVKERAEK